MIKEDDAILICRYLDVNQRKKPVVIQINEDLSSKLDDLAHEKLMN